MYKLAFIIIGTLSRRPPSQWFSEMIIDPKAFHVFSMIVLLCHCVILSSFAAAARVKRGISLVNYSPLLSYVINFPEVECSVND